MPSPSSTLQPHSRLPTELNAIIIQQLPRQSLIQAASVCFEFQLEAEVHIYKHVRIHPAWSHNGRFLMLRNALASSPRRQALVKTLHFVMSSWGDDIQFWAGALGFLLSTLSNIKILIIPSFGDLDTLDPQVFFQTPSRFEGLHMMLLESSPRLVEFYASQSAIRRLSFAYRDSVELRVPSTVLPALYELVCPCHVVPLYLPGRSIGKVIIHHS